MRQIFIKQGWKKFIQAFSHFEISFKKFNITMVRKLTEIKIIKQVEKIFS